MSIIELLILALGLSMDAFAVSICKGLSVPKLRPKHRRKREMHRFSLHRIVKRKMIFLRL